MYFWAIGSPCPARATGRAARKAPTHDQTGAILKRMTGSKKKIRKERLGSKSRSEEYGKE
jgi:hypothetical protein